MIILFLFSVYSFSVACPKHITTISSNPYEIQWKEKQIAFAQNLAKKEGFQMFLEETKICSPISYQKLLLFRELQQEIFQQKEQLIWSRWKYKGLWEAQLSYAYYDFWISYAQENGVLLIWGNSRVRGGLISTAQGSERVTDYLYILLHSSWEKYAVIAIEER